MSKERDNRQPYGFVLVVTGLLIGFFLGAGIVYWYSNQPADYLITDHALEKIARIFKSSGPDERNKKSAKQDTEAGPQKARQRQQTASELSPSGEANESMQADSSAVAEFQEFLAQADDAFADSLYSDSLDYFNGADSGDSDQEALNMAAKENIQIRKDRLIGIRSYIITESEPESLRSEGSQILDSLIGGRTAAGPPQRTLYVEFWESPLNYTAYKMSRNRVILYGFDQIDLISVHYYDDGLYMKYYLNYFDLKYTAEFKPLIPVSNPDLLTKLEQQWP